MSHDATPPSPTLSPPRPPGGALRRYRAIFAVPGSAAFFGAGWLGRVPRSTQSLGAVLLIAGATGRYTLAALVAAAIVVGTAVVGPLWSRGMDRFGQRPILLSGLVASLLASLALLGAVTGGLPEWTWFVTAFLVGATSVDVGSATRARWSNLLPEGEKRHTAYSIESVADESVFVIGPPVVTILAAAVSPVLGFAVGLVLGIAGQLALVLQRGTTPAVHSTEAAPHAGAPVRSRPRLFRRLPAGVAGLLPVFLGVGVVFGSLDLTAVGYTEARGEPAAAGLLLALFALGSVISGLVFGTLPLRGHPLVRFGLCAVAYGIVVPVAVAFPAIPVLAVALLLAGVATTPLLISGMGLVEARVERARLTEALAWPSTAMSVGVTAGSSLAGILIDAVDARVGFTVTASGAVLVGLAGLITLLSQRVRSQRVTSLSRAD